MRGRPSKKVILLIQILLVLLVTGVLLYQEIVWRTQFEFVSPEQKEVVRAVYGLGTVEAEKTFDLKLGIPSRIEDILVDEGMLVEVDQLLAIVRIPEEKRLRSPISGTVTNIYFEEHEIVLAGQPILTITNLKDRFVQASLEQSEALLIARGQNAVVHVPGLKMGPLYGLVESVFPSEGQFLMRIDVPELPPAVLPGMSADISVEIDEKTQALLVPRAAVKNGYVRVLRKGRVKRVPVVVELKDDQWVEVTSNNISLNDKIVVRD